MKMVNFIGMRFWRASERERKVKCCDNDDYHKKKHDIIVANEFTME